MPELIASAPGAEARRADHDRQLLLHCLPEEAVDIARLTELALPSAMLTVSQAAGWSALHLSPDEWLLIGALDAPDPTPRIAGAGESFALSLVDVSERSLAIDITGTAGPDLLNGACPLDFASFGANACTRTLFGKVTIMLWRRGEAIRMSYPRSYDGYVCTLLRTIATDLADVAA